MPSAAYTPSFASASSSAARQEARPVPIVITRVHPGLARPCERAVRILERIEVRVGVDHVAARCIRASSSATTCSGSSFV